jgi:hypothetical protein
VAPDSLPDDLVGFHPSTEGVLASGFERDLLGCQAVAVGVRVDVLEGGLSGSLLGAIEGIDGVSPRQESGKVALLADCSKPGLRTSSVAETVVAASEMAVRARRRGIMVVFQGEVVDCLPRSVSPPCSGTERGGHLERLAVSCQSFSPIQASWMESCGVGEST